MMAKKNIAHCLAFLLVLVVFGITGCGYKTMPVPPQEIVPKAIADLRYELNERGVFLNWTFPAETLKGEELTNITSFKLFRAVVPADKYCENCPIPFTEPIEVEGGAVAVGKQKVGTYSTTLLRPGHLYFFKIRSKSGWWAESADSNIVSFMWDIPAASPQTPAATVADRKVMLKWAAVTSHMDGTTIKEPVKYQVFRSRGGGVFSPVGGLQAGLEYVDGQVVNGRKYQYKVQAVTMYEKGQVGGGVSPVVDAVPVDQTPPPVPTGVQGVRTAGSVKIVWEKVEAVDLKGYRIYRRMPGETKPQQVGEVDVPFTIFDDTSLSESDEWFYSVSSVDRAKPGNESKRSAEVEVRN
jgi:hypothetical protein